MSATTACLQMRGSPYTDIKLELPKGAANDCGFNRSLQHLDSTTREGGVAYPTSRSLSVIALVQQNSMPVWGAVIHDSRRPVTKRRHPAAASQAFSTRSELAEREEISRGIVAGRSIRSIAADLGRAPSTVSRELQRNGGHRRYRANKADQAAWDRAHRPKSCKLVQNRALARKKLQLQWAPRQISGWLKRMYPE